jgi:hypothetical protein
MASNDSVRNGGKSNWISILTAGFVPRPIGPIVI